MASTCSCLCNEILPQLQILLDQSRHLSSAAMASLARLRIRNPAYVASTIKSFIPAKPPFVRTIQTLADTTQLHETPSDSDPAKPFTVKLHEDSFRSYKCEKPDLEVQVTKHELLQMYQQMQTMRRMEMAADALYKAKLIRGFCHLAIGQVW
jgi:pyruvate dehydrogenase E1 component alpha subunit